MPKRSKPAKSRPKKGRRALVAGATGLVGQYVLGSLLASGAYSQVTAVVRKPLSLAHPSLKQVLVHYDRLELAGAALKADDVFCCLGNTLRRKGDERALSMVDYDYPLTLARMVLKRGARQFLVVSSMGADPSSRSYYLKIKGEMERDIMALPFETVCTFRPAMLLGKRRSARLGDRFGAAIATFLRPLLLGSLRRYRGVEARRVGRAMVKAALESRPGRRVVESDGIDELAS